MANINNFNFVGRLTAEPELIDAGGTAICTFSIAVNDYDKKKNGDVASFFEVKCFGHNANYVNKYANKGSKIHLEGRVKQERWEQEGQKRSKVVFYANNIELDGKKDAEGSGNAQPKYDGSQPYNANNKSQEAFIEDNPFNDPNIPF